MIYKNIQYGNTKGVTVVEFGNGSLNIVDSYGVNDDHRSILIHQQDARPIGSGGEFLKGMSADDFNPEVVLHFKNIEGLKVLKEFVDNIYNEFLSPPPQESSLRHGIQLEIEFPD
ncbi:hypothetical protein FAZ19_16170 [Sphingobacterium alkalisoli]|uniref:Uncharacterized protein n=1 Tax=Sphingobacterium alkalisoli TaxID=1874115 RepID=A0A4U0H0S0_9SPHI|nr:hypothetical protein [Sphingobacterium alkalisoli]TJY63802.1 hypothetical protein FAZ19_16170 [Sphingobacterium alkalisoli]GGH24788.1 hypothetical protein GCM10011418_32950 [Sphingobacterium alkalisoli]